jgi:HSP20 family protein
MALIRWNPWKLSQFLDDDIEFPTLNGLTRLGQGLNLYETDQEIIAEAALPGINEEQVHVTVEDGVVRVSGSNKVAEEEGDNKKYFMSTMASSYNYSFRIPQGIIDEQEPSCELENGVLKIIFKKVEPKAPKSIKVVSKKNTK